MKKAIIPVPCIALAVLLLTGAWPALAQKSKKSSPVEFHVPMTGANWQGNPDAVEFTTHKNIPSMKLSGKERIVLKNLPFTNGTIEYDVEPLEEGFAGVYFRMADSNETEYVYLRTSRAGNAVAMDAVQYAPYTKGVLLWDMYYWFQGPANIRKNDWNHIKLVISGAQMIVYVNDLQTSTLEIPRLEGNTQTGSIAFDGKCMVANVVVKEGATEGLAARAGFDPTHQDPRYIRTWQVSRPAELPRGKEPYEADFPTNATEWLPVYAERRGLINLTREFGGSNARRYVWMRTKVNAQKARKVNMSLGFSDDVWVFVNRGLAYVDKNEYRATAMRKKPDGRISIDNAHFEIPLKEGDNELLIGVANDFYSWGIIAWLDDLEGISTSVDFPAPPEQPKDLSPYTGTYKSADFPEIILTAENNVLMGKNPGQPPIALEYFDKDKFRYVPADLVVQFHLADGKFILIQGGKELTFVKQ